MKHLYLITACLILYANISFAQSKQTSGPYNFSLADCINYAYEHQDSVKNATLDVKSADYKIKETIGTGLPQVNGTISFQDFLKPPASVGPDFTKLATTGAIDQNAPLVQFPFGAVKYNNTYSLTASQLLFSGTFIVGLQAVKTFKELYQRSLVRSKIETNVNVTKAYYQVLVSGEQVKLLDANIAQLKQQLDQTTASNKQGFVEKIDVDRLTVQYDNLVTNRENVARAITLYIQMLKFQMGMPIDQELTLTDKLENIKLDQDIAQNSIDTGFYHRRIEYSLLETNLKLNMLDVKDKKAAFLPSASLNGGYGGVFQENHFRYLYDHMYMNSYIGLGINIPIFSGFQRSYQLKQSQVNVQKAQNDLENAKNGIALQAAAARITFYNSVQSLNNQKRSRELAEEVLRVSKIKYQQGVGSSIEVTQAQTGLETADTDYIQALYSALNSKVDMDKAYGKIN
ncbi:transporter [Mucilaginibacter sp. PPCGB 2223]|uniref:TolC family protein n=1 Tax=Mucilaginibacter sp. PPCGB 2223 TaxID=1886027 RepID=UPI00082425E3|nr:TolC family protein [Mucilaginibacter sp. PPCGB 2223]OCX53612.1 transporter [Mucilaginibacter sp. PPCGB 2223]